MPKLGHVQWDNVVYKPGALRVVGYRNGHIEANSTVETTGAPAAIRLTADRSVLDANGEDIIPVTVDVVDSKGRVVPTANSLITFAVHGVGINAGVGNGDPACHDFNQSDARNAFNGKCMVLVRTTSKPGQIVLQARSPGLSASELKFTSV